ncbi:MAG: hypothetical protein KGI75_30410, partial [Rhizobiaceae bacterium]|nr:hypothetical protein [Rhizobiaceae bacterium]
MIELHQALARKVAHQARQIWERDEIAVTTGAKQALPVSVPPLFTVPKMVSPSIAGELDETDPRPMRRLT